MILLDVTPLSLGIETFGGLMTVMIPRNTTLPTQRKETFSTAADDQPSVEVHVLQGERTESKYNRTLGNFQLQGIMPAARGVPKIEVTFDVDANGILSVAAKDTATGKDQKITITASSGLSEAEVQKMVKEAAEHEETDKVERAQIERRNKLDNLCYAVERTLRESKEKLQPADVSTLEALIREGRDAVEKQDDARVTGASERLEKEAHRIASAMASGAATAASPTDSSSTKAAGAARDRKDIVDAEFEDTHGTHP
jgi:molecular chaperone DnaK